MPALTRRQVALLAVAAALFLIVLTGCDGSPVLKGFTDPRTAGRLSREAVGTQASGMYIHGSFQVPLEVEGMRLTSFASGKDTSAMISSFLGPGFSIRDTYIPCYKGISCEAIFWIVELEGAGEAVRLLSHMQQRIRNSSQFEGYLCISDGAVGQLHYARFAGSGTAFVHNYFYSRANRVYWVSMTGARQISLLRKFLPLF